jgi:hypothetical protein
MRDLTDEEKGNLRYGCIFCGERLFWLGPQGGLSFNVYCGQCLAGFNVTHAAMPWQLIAPPDQRSLDDLAKILDGKIDIVNFFAHVDAAIEAAVRTGFDALKKKH